MAANASLSLTSLDVPTIEDSLRTFLSSQSQFKDFDFAGSNISALVRILALNAWRTNFYLNMVNAEGFLDSAQTLGAVLSHAKELNYTPRSSRSARANITLTWTGTQPSYTIQKGQTLSSIVDGVGLTFSIPQTSVVSGVANTFSLTTDVYEGRYLSDAYVMDSSDETQRLILSSNTVDTTSLTVVVYQDGSVAGDTYALSTTLLDIDDSSKVYFLQRAETGQYEVIFGDGVSGYRPPDGSTVILDYRAAVSGAGGNGARVFTRDFTIGDGVSNARVVTNSYSVDGDGPEGIESIRYFAPRHFQVQERAVTSSDYRVMLKEAFPEIRAVSAYGGETVDPPQYGRVMVAVDVSDVDGIPDSKRDEYRSFLVSRAAMTPVIVEPQYTYVSIDSTVFYNLNLTTLSPENIEAIVRSAISSYADANLDDFGETLRYSRLSTLIDESHVSIVGNQTDVLVYKKIPLGRGTQSLTFSFGVPLYQAYPEASKSFPSTNERTLHSDPFTGSGSTKFVVDDGAGNLWTASTKASVTALLQRCGTIDYSTGTVSLTNLTVDGYTGPALSFYVRTATDDVETAADTILSLEDSAVRVSVTPVRE